MLQGFRGFLKGIHRDGLGVGSHGMSSVNERELELRASLKAVGRTQIALQH